MTRNTILFSDKIGFKVFVNTMINHKESHIHNLGIYIISKQSDFYGLINTDTMDMKMFIDVNKAIDSMLDKHNRDKENQTKLF